MLPPILGVALPGVFTLRTLQDVDRIKQRVDENIKHAVVVGAGFIGLELVENLIRRGVSTSIVELQDQVLPPFDKEMSTPIVQILIKHGGHLILGDSAESIEQVQDGLTVRLKVGT